VRDAAPQPPTIAATLNRAASRLRAAGIANDLLDAQTLLAEAIGRDRTYLIVNFNQELAPDALEKYEALIERRAAGEPLQYITGRQEFYGLEFEVTPAVLIPRPETELIVEETLRLAHRSDNARPLVIDVGTGSGCIAVALARELEGARVIAVDISPAALEIARRNAARYDLGSKIEFVVGDLLSAVSSETRADFIVSNPPYVAAREMPGLQREVREWEPRAALTDEADGLSFYRRLLNEAPAYLKAGGHLLCELGYGQAASVQSLMDASAWAEWRVLDDLQGIPRTAVVRKR
jgi:release factor glutamine methyltransferase